MEAPPMISPLNIGLWIAQILLSFAFFVHGRMMITPQESMRDRFGYVFAILPRFRLFLGVAELLAVAGLILPGLTGVLPWLTPLAAFCLVIVMIGAIVFHIRRREYPNLVLNLILMIMAAFVAYGRWFLYPLG
jgi:uncharacterized membrane protein YphA (DoxX/SURF4 family)